MADRTFHKRFSVTARIGVVVFALLAGYFFWVKMAIIGIFLAIIIVGMIERILNTRFSSNRNVPVCDIISVHQAKTFMGLDHCMVIEYGAKNMVAIQPDNEEAFEKEIKKRQ